MRGWLGLSDDDIYITEQFKTRSNVKRRQHTKILIDLDNETKDSEKRFGIPVNRVMFCP